MTINSSLPQPVRLVKGVVGAPKVSGDGSTVVWNQMVGDNLEIMRYRGGKIEQLSHNHQPDMHPSLNLDGSVVAWTRFSSEDPQDPKGHWDVVVHRDGQAETTLSGGGANEMDPAVSRDGKVVAWSHDKRSGMTEWKIQKWENGQVRDVTDQGNNMFPVLSGDGRRVFWRHFDEDGGSDLWLQDEAGTVKPLTDDPKAEVLPVCTPDGRTLVYSKQSPQGDDDLYRYDLEKGGVSLVSGQKQVDETWACISAEGRQVAWTNFDRRKPEVDVQIYLKDGDQVGPLTSDHALHSYPSMSEDGRKLAWLWVNPSDTSQRAIYTLDRGGPAFSHGQAQEKGSSPRR